MFARAVLSPVSANRQSAPVLLTLSRFVVSTCPSSSVQSGFPLSTRLTELPSATSNRL